MNMFFFVLPQAEKNIYVFSKTAIEVRSWPDLKLVKTIPFSALMPGVQQLLVSEPMMATRDGSTAIIGIMQKAEHGPWWSSSDTGFTILRFGE